MEVCDKVSVFIFVDAQTNMMSWTINHKLVRWGVFAYHLHKCHTPTYARLDT